MLYHTKGIVFNYLKYRETSIIVRIFTEAFGTQSYIVNGARSAKSKGKIALYQPLTLLDMVVYKKEGKDIQRISEAKFYTPFKSIPFEPIKSSISIFLTEVLSKCLREEAQNEALFHTLFHAISLFDELNQGIENFHLQLLLKCSFFLGFKPQSENEFAQQLKDNAMPYTLSSEEYLRLEQLMTANIGEPVQIGNTSRRQILTHLVRYFQIHIESLREIKSIEVLKAVLNWLLLTLNL